MQPFDQWRLAVIDRLLSYTVTSLYRFHTYMYVCISTRDVTCTEQQCCVLLCCHLRWLIYWGTLPSSTLQRLQGPLTQTPPTPTSSMTSIPQPQVRQSSAGERAGLPLTPKKESKRRATGESSKGKELRVYPRAGLWHGQRCN